jgi:hypothetical protein
VEEAEFEEARGLGRVEGRGVEGWERVGLVVECVFVCLY